MKTIKFKLKYLKYLFWLGPMLVLAGATAGAVAGAWGNLPVGLIIAGIVIIGLWLLFISRFEESKGQPGFWRRRSTRAGTNALLATLAVLVLLGLINLLGTRYIGRFDLTENKVFTLAPETQQLVSKLAQPVKVWVFDPQQNPQDRELLESYRRQGDKFNYEFIDPNAQPTLTERLEVKKPGDIIVEMPSAKRKQFVQTVGEQERLTEAKLTNAIAQLTSAPQSTIYFLQGHGERPIETGQEAMSQAVTALQDKGYMVKPLNLVEAGTAPKDARVVVVAGPQKSLLKPEVDALKKYLDQGGNVMLLVDPNTNPGIDSLLADWGVTLDQRLVIDTTSRVVGLRPADVTVTQYGDHPITQQFDTRDPSKSLSFYSFARPVDVKQQTGIQFTPLLLTSDRVWAESDLKSQDFQFDPQSDRQGPLALGVALNRSVTTSKTATPPSPSPAPTTSPQASPSPSPSPSPTTSPPGSGDKRESRLVVIGNSSFAADGFFGQVINGDVFLNSVRWLSQQEQTPLSIRPKDTKNRRLTLTAPQANLIAWTSLVILPVFGFGTAFGVWWRRR